MAEYRSDKRKVVATVLKPTWLTIVKFQHRRRQLAIQLKVSAAELMSQNRD
jgi:hypothetical protein